jgi:hypothetical protein
MTFIFFELLIFFEIIKKTELHTLPASVKKTVFQGALLIDRPFFRYNLYVIRPPRCTSVHRII